MSSTPSTLAPPPRPDRRRRLARAVGLAAATAMTMALLPFVLAPPASTLAPSGSPAALAACTAPTWSASAVYTADNRVTHAGRTWRAKWWTQNETPGTTGEWGVWQDLGACGGTTTPLSLIHI